MFGYQSFVKLKNHGNAPSKLQFSKMGLRRLQGLASHLLPEKKVPKSIQIKRKVIMKGELPSLIEFLT